MHSYSLRELQSIISDFFLGNMSLQKTWSFVLLWEYRLKFEIQEQRKKYNCRSPTTFTAYCKGLNSIIVKEK